ncbi:transmembrane protein, putative (macronuclear) [Tetrahymena thermophila SB210]|uniref:Transmembrane protein, putative n=1 Tax=Tetrahymena thermophila (strain SB210) TaxID=312017 RepID=I7ML54_TETTS|nr:transmembrane protein, putative [Tetrahymena thermophila SB210]EAS01196.2 transmembrane protein, putative [Tetrahymena thermophila SB210]|eukprot:XP_001021441.2 transmembrane protein, putative [Tetrahymena thermophila SB210]
MLLLSFFVSCLNYLSDKKSLKFNYRTQLKRYFLNTFYMIPQLRLKWFQPFFGIISHFLILLLIVIFLSYIYFTAFILIEISSYFYGYYIHSLLRMQIFVNVQLASLITHYFLDIFFVMAFIYSDQSIYCLWAFALFHLILFLYEIVNLIQAISQRSSMPYLSEFQNIFYLGNYNKETYIATQKKNQIQIIRVSKNNLFGKIEYSQKKTMNIDAFTVIESIDLKRNILITQTDNQYLSFYSLPNLEFKFTTPLYKKSCIRVWDEKGEVIYVDYNKTRKTTDLDFLSIQDVFQKGFSLELTANFQHKQQLIYYGNIKIDNDKYQRYVVACNYPSHDIIAINIEKSEIDTLYKNTEQNSIKFKISPQQILIFSNNHFPSLIILDVPSYLIGRVNCLQLLSGFYPIQVKNIDYHIILYPNDSNKIDYFFLARIQNNSLKIIQRCKTFNTQIQEIHYDPILNIFIILTKNKIFFMNVNCEIITYNQNNEIQLNISIDD